MADGGLFVHKCARDAHEQITRLSDFISPTIVAMWNLRWQVKGFVSVRADATQQDLIERFALGSGERGNEIKRACIDNSWEEQKSRFSSILLINTIAIFEEYLERLVALSLSGDDKRRVVKSLQFPVLGGNRGYLSAYSQLTEYADELRGVFNSQPIKRRWYARSQLESLLLCYRFFKEARNDLVHNGGYASAQLVLVFGQFAPFANRSALGMKEVPSHVAPIEGMPIALDIRGINAFSNVVLKIIATYDTDLSDRRGALSDIDSRLERIEGATRNQIIDAEKQKRKINGLLQRSGMPDGVHTPAFRMFLKATDRIPSHW